MRFCILFFGILALLWAGIAFQANAAPKKKVIPSREIASVQKKGGAKKKQPSAKKQTAKAKGAVKSQKKAVPASAEKEKSKVEMAPQDGQKAWQNIEQAPQTKSEFFQKVVLRIYTNDKGWFIKKDVVCLFSAEINPLVCGKVIHVTKVALYLLIPENEQVRKGNEYRVAKFVEPKDKKGQGSYAFAKNPLYVVIYARYQFKYVFSAGFMTGFSYFVPSFHMQMFIKNKFSVGFKPFYFNDPGSDGSVIGGFGGFGTLDYHFFEKRFHGIFSRFGLGLYLLTETDNLNVSDKHTSPAFFLVSGYQYRFQPSGFHASLSVGFQYVFTPAFTRVNSDMSSFLPLILLDAGMAF